MADDNEPDDTHDPAYPDNALDPQIRAAARALIEQYARSTDQIAPGVPSEPINGTGPNRTDASTGDTSPVTTGTTQRRGRRFGTLSVGLTAAAAVIALVLVLVNGIDGSNEEDKVVTVEPAQEEPAPGPTLLVTLGAGEGYDQQGGTTAVLLDAKTLETLGELRLPSLFYLGDFGGTSLDQVSLVDGRLEFVYSTYTDMIDIVPRGTVAEATDMQAALWSENRLTADRLSYLMQLGPHGTLLTADRGRPTGSTDTLPGDLSGFDTVIDDKWTVTTGSGDDTSTFTWNDGPLPIEDTQVFTPDESAVVNLHTSSSDGVATIEASTLPLGDDCRVCSANARSFDFASVDPGFVILESGFLDDTTMWLYWDSHAPDDMKDPYVPEVGLGTLDLLSGATEVLPDPLDSTDPIGTLRPLSSIGDGTMFLQQQDTQAQSIETVLRWDGAEWTTLDLPPAPEGFWYMDVFALPGPPDSLNDDASPDAGAVWCDQDLEGPVPELPGVGQVVLDVSGSERQASQLDGLTEVIETLNAGDASALPHLWLKDCTMAVQLSDYEWDRLLMQFARTNDGRFALTGTDRWFYGPT